MNLDRLNELLFIITITIFPYVLMYGMFGVPILAVIFGTPFELIIIAGIISAHKEKKAGTK